nr:restriction endonuclease subunit S [Lysinibacillus sp. K60]
MHLEDICIEKGLVRGPFGGALKKEHFVKQGYKVYEQKNAIYKDINLGDYYIDENKFLELKRFEVNQGDFIVSCSGTIGRIYRIPNDSPNGVINQALLKIRINDKLIDSEYFYQYFQWESFQNRIIENTQGGAMRNLVGMEIFRKTLLSIPPLIEQKKVAEVLYCIDNEIKLLEQELLLTKEQKKVIMQQLLTGKIRVKV